MSTTATVTCDACGRSFKWKSELAGKRVKCKCGGRIVFPKTDPEAAHEPEEDGLLAMSHNRAPAKEKAGTRLGQTIDLPDESESEQEGGGEYDLSEPVKPHKAPAPPQPVAGSTCPHCNKPVPPNAVLCTSCGTNLKTGKKLGTSITQDRSPPQTSTTTSKPKMKGIEWLYLGGAVVVIGAILGVLDFTINKSETPYAYYVFIGGIIIWVIGTIWGIRGACGDNFALRLACRFVPFLGWYMIIKRSCEDWESMKQPVMTLAFGAATTAVAGVIWFTAAFNAHAHAHMGH